MFHVKHFPLSGFFIRRAGYDIIALDLTARKEPHMKKKNILISVLSVLGAASVIHYINEAVMRSAVSKFKSTAAGGNTYHWKHGDVYYMKEGAGSPVILLHDLSPGSGSSQWKTSLGRFSQYNTVYAIDLPGCGRSARPAVEYSVYFYVSMLRCFIRDIVKEPVRIIAAPSCEDIAYALAALEPERISELNIIEGEGAVDRMSPLQTKILSFFLTKPTIGKSLYNMLYSHLLIGGRLFANRREGAPVDKGDTELSYALAHLAGGNGRFLLASKLKGNLHADTALLKSRVKAPVLYYKDARDI